MQKHPRPQSVRPNRDKRLEWQREYDKNHKKEHAERSKKWAQENPDKTKEKQHRYNERHREERNLKARLKREQNLEHKNRQLEKCRQYYQTHKREAVARCAKRRAAQLQRTPKWANLKDIECFYRDCPSGFHVDHIMPLNGKEVSGLHVIGNLQYLTAEENQRKYNKIIKGEVMNKSIMDETDKEVANKLLGCLYEELELKISKIDNLNVLSELRMLYFQASKDDFRKLVEKRITGLGGTY